MEHLNGEIRRVEIRKYFRLASAFGKSARYGCRVSSPGCRRCLSACGWAPPQPRSLSARGECFCLATGRSAEKFAAYGLLHSRSVGLAASVPPSRDEWSSHSCKVYSHCFDVSLSRLANLSPAGSFAPAQSASRPSLAANPFRHFPSGSNPKRLKSLPICCYSPVFAAILKNLFMRKSVDEGNRVNAGLQTWGGEWEHFPNAECGSSFAQGYGGQGAEGGTGTGNPSPLVAAGRGRTSNNQ